jgi:hypothetical protein
LKKWKDKSKKYFKARRIVFLKLVFFLVQEKIKVENLPDQKMYEMIKINSLIRNGSKEK